MFNLDLICTYKIKLKFQLFEKLIRANLFQLELETVWLPVQTGMISGILHNLLFKSSNKNKTQTCLRTNYCTCPHYSMILDLIPFAPFAQLFQIAVPLAPLFPYITQDGTYGIDRLVQQQQLGNSYTRPRFDRILSCESGIFVFIWNCQMNN